MRRLAGLLFIDDVEAGPGSKACTNPGLESSIKVDLS